MIFSIVLLATLIIVNGIFSASELAFLSLDKVKLKKEISENNKKAKEISEILSNPSSFYPNYKGYQAISSKIIDKIAKKLEK